MADQNVFQSEKEIERLKVQNKLLSSIEKPLFDSLFSSRRNLSILDIGCNDGKKTVSLFRNESISSVIGIEYTSSLARKAETAYGDGRFRFLSLDASGDDFPHSLRTVMEERGIRSFDYIYLSFVLMHLSDPGRLLSVLSSFLSPGGGIVIIEADDGSSYLTRDKDDLLGTFLSILKEDRYSGNRNLGGMLENIVRSSGYGDVTNVCNSIKAGKEDKDKKEMIYTTFFSYLEEDVDLLTREDDCPEYRGWKEWLSNNLPSLKALILSDSSEISMGMKILLVRRGKDET